MSSFLRFVFTILIAGIVVNLAIVLLANARSQRRQAGDIEREKKEFTELLDKVSGHLRRMDMVVESRRIDAHNQAIDTTLLVRQYASTGPDQGNPLPIVRVVIPGEHVSVSGMVFSFDGLFAEDAPDFRVLRDSHLAYFTTVCGQEQPALTLPPPSAGPGGSDAIFSWIQRDRVPELTRLHSDDDQPTFYEARLWRYIWDIIREPAAGAGHPEKTPGWAGVAVQWVPPTTSEVIPGHTYSAFIGVDGAISIDRDFQPSIPDLMEALLTEGKKLAPSQAAAHGASHAP